jgi:glycosyltransferase involved in cell wall biosynthesis
LEKVVNVLIPVYEIQDYGGITSHTEKLIKGLQHYGHNVTLIILRCNDQEPYFRKAEAPKGGYASALSGASVHLLAGWYGVRVMSYGTPYRADQFRMYVDRFDYVIWTLPCPYNDEGEWRTLYDHDVTQVACIHDAHYERAYKHLDSVARHLRFIAPVNESALGAVANYPGKKKLVNNGHELIDPSYLIQWGSRDNVAVCAHVWKAWKQMHKVVEAAPLLEDTDLILGGDGIEGRYMRSKDKCKPKYKGLWDAFRLTTHTYIGVVPENMLLRLYSTSAVMIDLSWNERFASYGCHYNRSIVEGANNGCIPLLCTEFMAGSKVFPEGTYLSVSKDADAKTLAGAIDDAVSIPTSVAEEMLGKLRIILANNFDYTTTCLQYLSPAHD